MIGDAQPKRILCTNRWTAKSGSIAKKARQRPPPISDGSIFQTRKRGAWRYATSFRGGNRVTPIKPTLPVDGYACQPACGVLHRYMGCSVFSTVSTDPERCYTATPCARGHWSSPNWNRALANHTRRWSCLSTRVGVLHRYIGCSISPLCQGTGGSSKPICSVLIGSDGSRRPP
jgi:hypothetical protein